MQKVDATKRRQSRRSGIKKELETSEKMIVHLKMVKEMRMCKHKLRLFEAWLRIVPFVLE